jgi:hypothetical protein
MGAQGGKTDVSRTSTQNNVDDPKPPSSSTSNSQCADAVSTQWQQLSDRLLVELNKCKAFTPELKTKLTAGEKGLSVSERYYLRLSVLTQLAER